MDSDDAPDDRGRQPSSGDVDPELVRRSKVSPYLWFAAAEWKRKRKEASDAAAEPEAAALAPAVRVLIELTGPDTTELQRTGIPFEHSFGLFYVANVPLDRLDDLAGLSSILRIHHEQGTKPALDDSIPEIKANRVRNQHPPFSGTDKFTGVGVIIGIIDSGINILHPVFRLPNDQTKSRIRAILDQTVSPPVTFTKAQIEAAIATDTQIIQPGAMVGGNRVETGINDHTHGTHVAGIAAGNGKIAGNCNGEYTYVGVAPEAELVIVKHDFAGAPSLLAAIQFIANTAGAVPVDGIPCVINMSLGHSMGPHDGTDPMDKMIDDYLLVRSTLPGTVQPVVLVASAGNDGGQADPNAYPTGGGDNSHATGTIPPGGVIKSLRYSLIAEMSDKAPVTTRVDIRFAGANGVGCTLTPPGNNTSGGTNVLAPDSATIATFTEVTQGSTCQISTSLVPGAAAGARRINIDVTSTAAAKNQPGDWTIQLTNAGAAPITYHAWISGGQFERFKDDLSRANTIGSPGSSTSIIAVGNYASSGKSKGQIAGSSSRGPRLDGLQKPDISAPGVDICSAKRDFHTGCCCDCCCDSYIDESGTSMAAPHVTGAIALMLERNPALTHQQIKAILMANARHDTFAPAPNNDFGAGKLDVLALLNDPLVRGSGTIITGSAAAARSRPAGPLPLTELSLPKVPQLEEGTPLWRLLRTAEGQRLYELGQIHAEEVRGLVNSRKRVAVVWHRNHGPFLLHHVTRTVMLPHVPLPHDVDGVELSIRAARLVSALEPYASKALIRAMHETLPLIAELQGKTLLDVVEMFEAFETEDVLEHA